MSFTINSLRADSVTMSLMPAQANRLECDTRTGVAMPQYRYDVPFKFTGKINKLTFKLEAVANAGSESKAELAPMEAPEPDPIEEAKR